MGRSLKDKVVWITGGGSGIGREMALEFARQGARVAVSGRRQDRLDAVAKELQALGSQALAVACDVTSEDDLEQAVAAIVAHFGHLDIAVANAGFAVAGTVDRLSAEDWRRQFDTNVVGVAITAKHVTPALEATRGQLAVIGSVAGSLGMKGTSAYSSSKAAVRILTEALSVELAPRGIHVTLIQPGFVKSEIAQVDNEGIFRPEFKDRRPAKLMWDTDRAARVIVKAIRCRRRIYTFTIHGKLAHFLGMHAPGLVNFLLKRSGKSYKRNEQSPD